MLRLQVIAVLMTPSLTSLLSSSLVHDPLVSPSLFLVACEVLTPRFMPFFCPAATPLCACLIESALLLRPLLLPLFGRSKILAFLAGPLLATILVVPRLIPGTHDVLASL